jgi:hypothetical protein
MDEHVDELVVAATFTSRHEADLASATLEDAGISSFVAADDVHPPLQISEGARLMVMSNDAPRARAILADLETDTSSEATEVDHHEPAVRTVSWLHIAGFVAILLALIVGLIIG